MRAHTSGRALLFASMLVVGVGCADSVDPPDAAATEDQSLTFADSGEYIPQQDGAADLAADSAPDLAVDVAPILPDITTCIAGEFISCTAGLMVRCNTTGDGVETVDCAPYLCNAAARRCNECDPSTAASCDGITRSLCTANGLRVSEVCDQGCSGGLCQMCATQALYLDDDGDGYGDSDTEVAVCTPPPGAWLTTGGDCDDADADAHPNQTKYFAKPTMGSGNFDYNCDSVEEKANEDLLSGCSCGQAGWSGSVPDCGIDGTFTICIPKPFNPTSCTPHNQTVPQTCR